MWWAIAGIAAAGGLAMWQGFGAVRDSITTPESDVGKIISGNAMAIALVVVGVVLLIALGRRG
jgi:hypothetical protein